MCVGKENGEKSKSKISELCPLSESSISCCHPFQLENPRGEFTVL